MEHFEVGQRVISTRRISDGWGPFGSSEVRAGTKGVVTARHGFMSFTYDVTFTTPGGMFFNESVDRLAGIPGSSLARA